jgi:hypothetical protein
MKSGRVAALLGAALLSLSSFPSAAQQILRSTQTVSLPSHLFPTGADIGAVKLDAYNDVVIFSASGPTSNDRVYEFSLRTKRIRQLLKTDRVQDIFLSPHGGRVAVTTWSKGLNGQERRDLYVFDESGKNLAHARHPNNWNFGQVSWTSGGSKVLFWRNRPTDNDDGGGEAFSAIGILDVASGTASWLPLKNWVRDFTICPADQRIYVWRDIDDGSIASVYDVRGHWMGNRPSMKGISFSATGKYYSSFHNEGAAPWGIYDSRTNKRLLQFSHGDTNEFNYGPDWNPVKDDLFLAVRGEKTDGPVDLYSVSKARVIRTFSFGGHVEGVGWSNDGAYLVRPLFKSPGHKIEIDRVGP